MIEPVVRLEQVGHLPGRVVVADVRFYLDGRSGRDAYVRGHLPGAIFVDLHHDLAEPGVPEYGRHPLPDAGDFAERMAALGLDDGDTVIAYDDAGGVMAARLVWMLRATGHDAALLDGGFQTYVGELEHGAGPQDRPRGSFAARPWPANRLATIDEAAKAGEAAKPDRAAKASEAAKPGEAAKAGGTAEAGGAAEGRRVVIDARPRDRFRGENETIDPRPGHIPGAVSVPCRENVDERGHFRPAEELRERFAAAGVTDGSEVISYCGSGVTACHNLLALEYAGFAPGRLFPGSWSQYSHTDRPAATGD